MANRKISDLTALSALTGEVGVEVANDIGDGGSPGSGRVTPLVLVLAGFEAMGLVTATVATLGSASPANRMRWVSDALKNGESTGEGTGVLAIADGTNWVSIDNGGVVSA